MIDSVIRVNKKYYSQTLLEGCKYEIIIKKFESFIIYLMNLIVNLIMYLIVNQIKNLKKDLVMISLIIICCKSRLYFNIIDLIVHGQNMTIHYQIHNKSLILYVIMFNFIFYNIVMKALIKMIVLERYFCIIF